MTAKLKPHKKPSFNKTVETLKKPVIAGNPEEYLERNPAWRVGLLELCDPYGWHILTLTEATGIQERLKAFESMTWKEILFVGDKKQNHYMEVGDLSKNAQDRMQELAPDVDVLMSLRISKKERVFGIMDGAICHVVFWDPNHQIYEMNIADN